MSPILCKLWELWVFQLFFPYFPSFVQFPCTCRPLITCRQKAEITPGSPHWFFFPRNPSIMWLVYNIEDQLFQMFCRFLLLLFIGEVLSNPFIPSWALMITLNYIFLHLEFILVEDKLIDEFWITDNCHPTWCFSLFI